MIKVNFVIWAVISAMVLPAWAVDDKTGDLELLEYLGSFETGNGKPLDPLLFLQDSKSGKKKKSPVNQGKDNKKQQKDKSELKERDYEK